MSSLNCTLLPRRIRSKFTIDSSGCWLWTAYIDHAGYARIRLPHKSEYAHRRVYELLVGPIPNGLVIDHLCRVRHCVNPEHMEPVTNRINIQRGYWASLTHCRHGHAFDTANTRFLKTGGRTCRACVRIGGRERRRKLGIPVCPDRYKKEA